MDCLVYQRVRKGILTRKQIKKIAAFIFQQLNRTGAVSIHLTGEKRMKFLNERYRHKQGVTDVLSFAMIAKQKQQKQQKENDWGEVFICVPQIIRQARGYQISPKEEMVRMLAHGLLHLFGFDHQISKEAKKMFRRQEKLVKSCL